MKTANGRVGGVSRGPDRVAQRGRWPTDGLMRVGASLFLIRLAAGYFGLLLLWYPIGDFYHDALMRGGNFLAAGLGRGHDVVLRSQPGEKPDDSFRKRDLAVLVRIPGLTNSSGQRAWWSAKTVVTFYQPFMATVFTVALFLASPLPWPQRLVRAGAGLLLLHTGMVICVAIDVSHAVGGFNAVANDYFDWTRTILSLLHHSITDWPAGVLVIPLLLWAALGAAGMRTGQEPRGR